MKEPPDDEERREFSGQLRLRMPTSLHRDLVRAAEAEGVSLNQFICAVLAAELGWSTRSRENVESRSHLRKEEERQRKNDAVDEMWRKLLNG